MRKALLGGLALAFASLPLAGQDKGADEKPPAFDKTFLSDPANIEIGKKVWDDQCRHCHGASAYPGKAPKLNPGQLDPEHIFDRVTNGFGKMPPWKHVYSVKERAGVVAYIKSGDFSP
jgi:mono/diheme cytochrome c family protein